MVGRLARSSDDMARSWARPRTLAAVAAVAVAAALAGGCGDDEAPADPLKTVIAAAERTAGAGASSVEVAVGTADAEYSLAGTLDLAEQYRLLAEVEAGPVDYLQGQEVWIARVDGDFGTLTRSRPDAGGAGPPDPLGGAWFDDHPPTLPLDPEAELLPVRPGGLTGAEDYLHLALLALRETPAAAASAEALDEPDTYRVLVGLDRDGVEPPDRDEDFWTLEPLAKAAGELTVEVEVEDGYLHALSLEAPALTSGPGARGGADRSQPSVAVSLVLSDYGEADPVPLARATAIE